MLEAFVVAYDPAWPEQFAAAASGIEVALAEVLIGPVKHIGSTSIPGMIAKPILDMMAPVASLTDAVQAASLLDGLGYAVRPHRVDAVLYVRPPAQGVHLTTVGSDLWRERLAFRDALRANPELCEEYSVLKRELLAASGDSVYDSADKREFVRRVLARSGHQLRDGLRVRGTTTG